MINTEILDVFEESEEEVEVIADDETETYLRLVTYLLIILTDSLLPTDSFHRINLQRIANACSGIDKRKLKFQRLVEKAETGYFG